MKPHQSKTTYYQAVKKLKELEDEKYQNGTNYVIEQKINKYQNIIDQESDYKDDFIKIEYEPPLTKREFNDQIRRKVRNLENKIKRSKANWVDIFLYDVWTKTNTDEWRLPI